MALTTRFTKDRASIPQTKTASASYVTQNAGHTTSQTASTGLNHSPLTHKKTSAHYVQINSLLLIL
jgi:hypothetical protein